MKIISFKSVLLVAVLIGSISCEKEPIEVPNNSIPPQQQLPNPLPANALVRQLKWAERDHQTFTYNANGQVSQLRSQWQYVEGDPNQIRTIVYDFEYDAQGKPIKLNTSDQFYMNYYFQDTLVERIQEFFPGGAVLHDITYYYKNKRIVQELRRSAGLPGQPVSVSKYLYEYDPKGNLNKIEHYLQADRPTPENQYELVETIEYSDFDDRLNPISWLLRDPLLPQVQFQWNNPGKRVRRYGRGAPDITTFTYEYNASGLPIVRRSTNNGQTLVMQYLY